VTFWQTLVGCGHVSGLLGSGTHGRRLLMRSADRVPITITAS
jgi:hypothetical protein